jgi:ABC-type nitrate/sulfonate/bicarbonate transport system permease component
MREGGAATVHVADQDSGRHVVPEGTAHPLTSRRPPRARLRQSPGWVLTAIVVAFAVVWEAVSRLSLIEPSFISRPTAIAQAVPELAADARVREAVASTVASMGWAILYGIIAGVILGYLLGTSRLLRDAFYGPSLFLLSVPKSIFIPIFLVLFGINSQTAVYYGAFSAFIYVMINVIGGLDLVEDRHLRVAYAYRAGLRHRIVDVVFPASMPGLFTGIWYGLKNGLQGVLIFELFISVGGLGGLIRFYTNGLRTDRVFAIILGVAITAILLGEAWSRIEARLSRWRPKGTSGAVTQQAT